MSSLASRNGAFRYPSGNQFEELFTRKAPAFWRPVTFGIITKPKGWYSFCHPKEGSEAESTQALQVRMLRSLLKAAVHNEFGLSVHAVAGLEPQTRVTCAEERNQRLCPLGKADTQLFNKSVVACEVKFQP